MTLNDRISEINQVLPAFTPALIALLNERIAGMVERLISQDNEQLRGAIKECRALLDLPMALQSERDQLSAALSDPDAA